MNKENIIAIVKIILSSILLLLGIFLPIDNVFKVIIFIVSYVVISYDIIFKAIKNIFHDPHAFLDEFFLMSLASLVALALQEYSEAIAVMILYQIGELLQDLAVDKSRKSITAMMNLIPETTRVIRDDQELEVASAEVKLDELMVVKPGERIPLDGIVEEGESLLDMSSLTGESLPVKVLKKSEVFSGTINLNSRLVIRVKSTYENSTATKILSLIEEASSTKGENEKFITKFARIYTPLVVLLAIVLAVLPPLFDGLWTMWLHRALSFLVVSCPCALVISIPLSFFSGIGYASKQGILIKGSTYIEQIAKLKAICFDKTGTLTKGNFAIIDKSAADEERMIKLLASLEHNSLHPLANAITASYDGELKEVKEYEEVAGMGLKGKIDDKVIIAGNDKLMEQFNINYSKNDSFGTTIYVAYDNQYLGYVTVGDEVKKEAKATIEKLHDQNIKAVMLTGDKKENTLKIQSYLKLDEVHYELMPQDKVSIFKTIKESLDADSKIAFVGDGLNDAPVLALSDVGFAMGGLGSDAALEASDVVILNDDIQKIPLIYRLSKRTIRIVKENIIFSIAIKILVLILSTLGYTNMFLAIFADVGVALIAILNAMRNLVIKIKQ